MTVQSLLAQLTEKIDPYTKSGVEITAATVCTVDGDRFTKQRLLNVWNEARRALAGVLNQRLSKELKSVALYGLVTTRSDLAFNAGRATKPDGYLESLYITKANGDPIPILPLSMRSAVVSLQSVANPFVFDDGNTFDTTTGATSLPNAGTYILKYYGLTDFTLTDVTSGTRVETFNDLWHPILLQIAEALANEQGSTQVNALANALIGGK